MSSTVLLTKRPTETIGMATMINACFAPDEQPRRLACSCDQQKRTIRGEENTTIKKGIVNNSRAAGITKISKPTAAAATKQQTKRMQHGLSADDCKYAVTK